MFVTPRALTDTTKILKKINASHARILAQNAFLKMNAWSVFHQPPRQHIYINQIVSLNALLNFTKMERNVILASQVVKRAILILA